MNHSISNNVPEALQLLDHADEIRRAVAPGTSPRHKAHLGQFMTPSSVARFMARLFPASNLRQCSLLDAGAGVGALTCAFLDRWAAGGFPFASVDATAYEIDPVIREHLEDTLAQYATRLPLTAHVVAGDFIELVAMQGLPEIGRFTHAILNPPYKKINSGSPHRLALRSVGIETVNLYSAFVALSLALMAPGGQVVAIIPRSFCNGPYYRPFRDFVLTRAAIRHLHLFESRNKAFKDDDVLQENVIILLECGARQGSVVVSTSTDDGFSDLASHEHAFDQILIPGDPERFIHIPTSAGPSACDLSPAVGSTLDDLEIKVSTGPVVDFRLKEHLRAMPEADTVPLLYPGHFTGSRTQWPQPGSKKPNAIVRNSETERWLYPNGFYCVVRRFSSKEERRRIVASVIDPSDFKGADMLGLENHLNVFHHGRQGLPEPLARGLALYLNTTAVDEHFRRFSGHTQVNATDLKLMKYPSRAALEALGRWACKRADASQDEIDQQLEELATWPPDRISKKPTRS